MRKGAFKSALKAVNAYVIFFLTVAFAVSCCMLLFLNTFSNTMGFEFTSENIGISAKLTFFNVVLITIIFGSIDFIRRKITVDRPVRKITQATEKIMNGDFSTRIEPFQNISGEGFNNIAGAINLMAKELSSIETLRTDFIANVSHEMKTPLSVIQNYGVLLASDDLPKDKRIEYAKAITDSSRRLADMMTNILKLNRLENQQIYPQVKEYNLSEQICQCLLNYESVWERKSIEIETDIQEGVIISADYELLSLVWNNLFSNAFKFTEENGRVSVSLYLDQEYALVKISDTGCGMSVDTGAHIFEKFYQGDTSHATQGNGLGLALVKRVIDIIEGEIGVESTLGKGSTFTVKIRRGNHELEENR